MQNVNFFSNILRRLLLFLSGSAEIIGRLRTPTRPANIKMRNEGTWRSQLYGIFMVSGQFFFVRITSPRGQGALWKKIWKSNYEKNKKKKIYMKNNISGQVGLRDISVFLKEYLLAYSLLMSVAKECSGSSTEEE